MKGQKTHQALVVGAEAPLQRVLGETLHRAGFWACSVPGELGLLQRIAAIPVDIILLNLHTPGVDGLSLCASLRQISDVPILLLLKQGRVDEIVEGYAAGADDCLCQPFEPLDLLIRIQALMRRVAWHTLAARAPTPIPRLANPPVLKPWAIMM